MTSEWLHVFPISVKNKGARESSVVTSTVLKIERYVSPWIELIGFQQSMQIERGYQTAISKFEMFENFKNMGK